MIIKGLDKLLEKLYQDILERIPSGSRGYRLIHHRSQAKKRKLRRQHW